MFNLNSWIKFDEEFFFRVDSLRVHFDKEFYCADIFVMGCFAGFQGGINQTGFLAYEYAVVSVCNDN